MKRKLLMTFSLLFTLLFSISAQERVVTGTVIDPATNEPLPGVAVVAKGTGVGVVTDIDGKYRLSVPAGATTLVFQFVGFRDQEVAIGSRSVVDVNMMPDVSELDEVIITGYRSETVEKSSISAKTVSAESIENRPNPSFAQTLSGQVAGLNIATGTGQPGGNSTINIRGINSINGDTEPLFVIDGTPVDQDNFRSLNPNEIASVSVLKDAGATAIYGNRGANGVIVIETKRGRYNSPLQITYTGMAMSSRLQSNSYDAMNAQQQLELERSYGNGRGVDFTDAEIAAAENFDWLDFFFREATGINHNLQLRKGGDQSTVFVSLGYLNQEGVLIDSELERYNLRTNLNGRSANGKFTYDLNSSINYSTNNEPNNIGAGAVNRNFVLGAYQSVPYITPADYIDGQSLADNFGGFVETPLLLYDLSRTFTRVEDEVKMLGSLNLGYEIVDGLRFNVRGGADYESETTVRTQAPNSFNSAFFAEDGNVTPGFADHNFRQQFTYNQVTSLTYGLEAGENTFGFGLYTEYFKAHLESFGFFAEGLNPKTFSPGDGSGFVGDNADNDYFVDDARADILSSGLFSYFGQIDWDYSSRFGANATLRRDASSRFAESNRWGTFWSVAGRWNIHNEDFMEGSPFNLLKLRASYGTNGNQNVSGSGYFNALDLTLPFFATGGGYRGAPSIFLSQIPNEDLKWETVTQANVGIDFEMFTGRLRGTFEAYRKETTDLFQSQFVSAVTSVTALNANVGSLENRGFDLDLHYDVFKSTSPNQPQLTLNFVGNYNKNEITELPDGQTELIGTGRVGGPIFEYYQYRYAGVNPANGNKLFLTANDELTETPNVDTDRVWTNKNIYPDYIGSVGFDFSWKGLFVTTLFNYTIGTDRFDNDYAGLMNPASIGDFRHSSDILDAWTPENRGGLVPSNTASNLAFNGDRWITDNSYSRLRFASIGYNLPQSLISKAKLRTARVFLNGENLITFSKWRGFDPEALDNSSRIYPTPRTYSVGIEIGL